MTRLKKSLIFCLVIALVALVDMATDLYIPLLPEIEKFFDVNAELASATISLNLVSIAISGLFYGSLSDAIGRRPVIIGGLCIFVLASYACGLATSIAQLLIARTFQGIGGGVAFSVGIAVVRDLYSGGAQGAAKFSLLQGVISLSPGLAPIIGGIIGCYYGWSAIFWILAAVSAVLLILFMMFGTETLPPDKRLIRHSHGMRSEYSGFFKNRLFMVYATVQVLALAWLWAELAFLPTLLEAHYQVPLANVGFYIGASVAMYALGTLANQKLVHIINLEMLVYIGISAFIFSSLLLCIAQHYHYISPWKIIALKAPASFGFALVFGNAATLALDQVNEKSGSASALIGACELIAGAIAILIINLFAARTVYPLAFMIALTSFVSAIILFKNYNKAGIIKTA
jgi:DHA1 family bicyclomycin/chloramphenicol resistance-like MFS transporter